MPKYFATHEWYQPGLSIRTAIPSFVRAHHMRRVVNSDFRWSQAWCSIVLSPPRSSLLEKGWSRDNSPIFISVYQCKISRRMATAEPDALRKQELLDIW